MIPSGFISTSPGLIACISSSCASLLKGAKERPWKEEDQSTLFPVESTGTAEGAMAIGSSERPSESERTFLALAMLVTGVLGASFVGAVAVDGGVAVL